jgi:uncharacterized protein (TIRG00374 family)
MRAPEGPLPTEALPPAGATPVRRKWRALLAAAGYCVVLALALLTIDRERFLEIVSRLSVGNVALVVALLVLHVGARALRYHALAVRSGAKNYGMADGIRIFLIGLSASAVTPARAGDLVKAQLLHEHDVPRSTGLGLVVIERLLDLCVVTGTIVVTGALLARQARESTLQLSAAIVLAGLLCTIVALSIPAWRRRGVRVLARFSSRFASVHPKLGRLEEVAARTFTVWDEIFSSPPVLARYLMGSAFAWIADFLKLWVLLVALGEDVPVLPILFVYPVSLILGILSLLPFSEGVVGVAAVTLLKQLLGVDTEVATAAVAIDRGISTLLPIFSYGAFAAGSHLWRWRRRT